MRCTNFRGPGGYLSQARSVLRPYYHCNRLVIYFQYARTPFVMFFSSLRAPLVTLVAYVAIVSSAPSVAPRLTVKTSTSDLNIDRLENLNVTTTVVNTGRVSLKLLNDPRGVLDPFPENSFTFTNPSGSQPSFVGARVNHTPRYMIDLRTNALGLRSQASYNSTLAAGLDDPTAFTVLSPGGSVNVTHDREWIVSIGFASPRVS